MLIEPCAPPVSFVYSDSDMDNDETWEQIKSLSYTVYLTIRNDMAGYQLKTDEGDV